MPQPRRAWRQSLRAQPTCSPRPAADATRRHPIARRAPGNHRHSHRLAGHPVSLALWCGTATEPEPTFPPAPVRLKAPRAVLVGLNSPADDILQFAHADLRGTRQRAARFIQMRNELGG